MTRPREIRRQPSRSLQSGAGGAGRLSLPPDVVAKAGNRLSLAALTYAVVYLLAYASGRFTEDWSQYWDSTRVILMPDLWAGLFIGVSVAMFFFARAALIDSRRLLDIGLVQVHRYLYRLKPQLYFTLGFVFAR